ncbi:MAG: flavodoxin domain-containing protein [Ruminococcus sp.]
MANNNKPKVIVYTSKTGHTQQYAHMLGEKTGLPVYSLKEASLQIDRGSNVVYLGWIHASNIKGYSHAAKHFSICAVCGVGLCDTRTLISEVRKAASVPESVPLFTMQGGFDRSKLKGIDKLMISMLTKGLASQKQRSQQDERMLELLSKDENYVSEENLSAVLEWYSGEQ